MRSYVTSFLCCSSQLQPACNQGLMALCTLGLVSGDATLAGAALGELMKNNDGEIILVLPKQETMRFDRSQIVFILG